MNDYYKLLQVDASADREIIEVAYKKLAKKYHPDVCKEEHCLDVMRKINEAYEILSKPTLRSQYDHNRKMTHQQNRNLFYDQKYDSKLKDDVSKLAYDLLKLYFESIMKKEYSKGYNLIHASQREKLSLTAFKNWQHWTSRIYDLINFNMTMIDCKQNLNLDGYDIDYLMSFDVEVLEYNQIMEQHERGHFVKQVRIKDRVPSIYLEQTEVSDVIRRYEKLAKLKVGKWQAGKLKMTFNMNKSETLFFRQLDKEVERFSRYSIPFSMIFLKITNDEPGLLQSIVHHLRGLIEQNLRKLDEFILLDKHVFLIVLPSARLIESTIVAEKICEIIDEKSSLKPFSFTVKRIVIENETDNSDEFKEMIQQVLKELV